LIPNHQAEKAELSQARAASERYRSTAPERARIERLQKEEDCRIIDSHDQVQARVGRLIKAGQVPMEALTAAVSGDPKVETHRFYERVIAATNDLQPVNFLPRGARAARRIARISIRNNGRPFGTGSLVSPHLLMTNNHVLPDIETAEQCVAEFNCEIDLDMKNASIASYEIDPSRLFVTNEHLDYTLVALEGGPDGRAPGDEFGWSTLIEEQGKIVTGEPVNIVGHPMGRAKEMSIRHNLLQNQVDDFLHYTTDTEPGNSGSPVFNDQWEMVALHHAGVPSTDDAGNLLKSDGSIWRESDGEGALHWVANEGARVSVILRDLKGRQFDDQQRDLIRGMGIEIGTMDSSTPATPQPSVDQDAVVVERQPSTPAKPGLKARGGPYGGATQLVFLHGRSQHGYDPAALRRKWTAGLAKGLSLKGLPAVDAADVWFPFYGDAFAHALGVRESMAPLVHSQLNAAEALAPTEESTRDLYATLIEEAAGQAGMPPGFDDEMEERESFLAGVVSKVQKQLTWLANRSGLDELLIAAVFRDVADYLDRSKIRDLVLSTVMQDMPQSGKVVLVSHSLGTVVGLDLLEQLPSEVEVKHMITAGSPLGMDGVYKRLLTGGAQKPERVTVWMNAWCPADAVAIGCPLNAVWGPFVSDVVTNNPKERAHSIEEYLADQRVATLIGRSLGAGG
jgi:endonuclease G, mitochondrial